MNCFMHIHLCNPHTDEIQNTSIIPVMSIKLQAFYLKVGFNEVSF